MVLKYFTVSLVLLLTIDLITYLFQTDTVEMELTDQKLNLQGQSIKNYAEKLCSHEKGHLVDNMAVNKVHSLEIGYNNTD